MAAVGEAVRRYRPKLLFVTSPNNPDGGWLPDADLARLLEGVVADDRRRLGLLGLGAGPGSDLKSGLSCCMRATVSAEATTRRRASMLRSLVEATPTFLPKIARTRTVTSVSGGKTVSRGSFP